SAPAVVRTRRRAWHCRRLSVSARLPIRGGSRRGGRVGLLRLPPLLQQRLGGGGRRGGRGGAGRGGVGAAGAGGGVAAVGMAAAVAAGPVVVAAAAPEPRWHIYSPAAPQYH